MENKNKVNGDKIKQFIGFIGGALGGVLLFLQSLGIDLNYFTEDTISSFTEMLETFIPLIFVGYGIWKNQYILSNNAKNQEKDLKERGLK